MLRRKKILMTASVVILLLACLSIVFVTSPRASGKEKYATLSDQEKQQIVDEVWSRLEAQGYTEQIVGWGYTDEGFVILFKGKADSNVLSIIREVIEDLPLKIYEDATCKKVPLSVIPSSWEDAVNLVLEKASSVEVRNVTGHVIAYFNRGEPD